jgi:hypothetical protein
LVIKPPFKPQQIKVRAKDIINWTWERLRDKAPKGRNENLSSTRVYQPEHVGACTKKGSASIMTIGRGGRKHNDHLWLKSARSWYSGCWSLLRIPHASSTDHSACIHGGDILPPNISPERPQASCSDSKPSIRSTL